MQFPEGGSDGVLQQDLEAISASDLDWERFRGKSFFITGATGLIGSALVRTLCCVNREHGTKILLYLLVRSAEKARSVFGDLLEREKIQLIVSDVCVPLHPMPQVDYIIHAAAVTNSKQMVTKPAETVMTSVLGTENMLKFALQCGAKSMIYLSSMEVYGKPAEGAEYVREGDYGYIDPLNIRSGYPESKRLAECLCASFAAEYGVPVKIARLAQTFGAGVPKTENRVFSQFARSLMNGTDIVLHTDGGSYGNYCYTSDTVRAVLFLLYSGKNGEAYNVTNESTNIRIRDMAQLVADMSGGKIKVVFDIPEDALKYGYAPSVKLRLCGGKLYSLGWKPTVGLEEMYRRLIQSLETAGEQ